MEYQEYILKHRPREIFKLDAIINENSKYHPKIVGSIDDESVVFIVNSC